MECTTVIHKVCHAESVSCNAGNAMVEIPADTRALLELPEASGEAMTKEKSTFIHNVFHAAIDSHNAGNAMVMIPADTRALLELAKQ
jgi:hypothetical protein